MSVNTLIVYVEADRLIIRWHRLIIIDSMQNISLVWTAVCLSIHWETHYIAQNILNLFRASERTTNIFWSDVCDLSNVLPVWIAACVCNRAGSTYCNPDNGDCVCKPGVAGLHCDQCMLGYWGFDEYGCKPCQCAGDCDPYTGDCMIRWLCPLKILNNQQKGSCLYCHFNLMHETTRNFRINSCYC